MSLNNIFFLSYPKQHTETSELYKFQQEWNSWLNLYIARRVCPRFLKCYNYINIYSYLTSVGDQLMWEQTYEARTPNQCDRYSFQRKPYWHFPKLPRPMPSDRQPPTLKLWLPYNKTIWHSCLSSSIQVIKENCKATVQEGNLKHIIKKKGDKSTIKLCKIK